MVGKPGWRNAGLRLWRPVAMAVLTGAFALAVRAAVLG
jgi:hypothetical protein